MLFYGFVVWTDKQRKEAHFCHTDFKTETLQAVKLQECLGYPDICCF